MAYTMAATSRRSSTGSVLAAVLLAAASCQALLTTFVGGLHAAAAPRVPARVNIFDFNLPTVGGSELNPDEVGSKSQREADEKNTRLVEISLPLGIRFEEKNGGDIFVQAVDESSDAYAQGIRPGCQVAMVSATFGDEMWQAEKVGMTQYMNVINSRFGNTIKLALKGEDKNFLGGFLDQFKPKKPLTEAEKQEAAKKQKKMSSVFEEEEAKLADKNFWNPFR